MGMGNIFIRFRKQVETTENHPDHQLKTHYYKGTFNQVFTSIEQFFRQESDCQISTISKEHGEMAIEMNKPIPCFLIVTIVTVKPLEVAVDFTISTERSSIIGNYPVLKSRIVSFYERINKLNTFIR